MNTVFGDLITNLSSGVKLCLFRKLGPESFRISADQFVILYLFNIALSIFIGYLENLPDPQFNKYTITNEGFSAATLLLSVYIVSRLILHRQVATALSVLILSTSPYFFIIWHIAESVMTTSNSSSSYWLVYGIYIVWLISTILWCIRILAGTAPAKITASFLVVIFTWIVPVWIFAGNISYWYSDEGTKNNDSYSAYRDLNAERILFTQSSLLNRDLQKLQPQRPGIVDLYFIGVGAYATQDVFLKETLYAKNLFDQRFDTQGRSLALVNHLSTHEDMPLATSTNLEKALHYIGTLMNKDEDVLVLYMTSHGSSDHELSVSFWPLPLNDITPAMLRDYLDKSGIKWQVVMISACYSGGFVEPLKTPHVAIATAAAPDRTSFGCSNENDFTYFGEALLKDQLQKEFSIPAAFSRATIAITERESKENLTASHPQTFIGDAIRPLLDDLTTELKILNLDKSVNADY
ncbi:MAG: C13 family peptidase [Gammaproteobacteria bacterium]